jgi:hypothetical protein
MFDKKLTSEVQGLRSSHQAPSQGVQALQQASLLGAIGQHCQCWRTLLAEERLGDPRRLERYGHKCCSQNEEDGILLEIFNGIGVRHRIFIEFGDGDGLENNTLFWLAQGWKGPWIDGDSANRDTIQAPLRRSPC